MDSVDLQREHMSKQGSGLVGRAVDTGDDRAAHIDRVTSFSGVPVEIIPSIDGLAKEVSAGPLAAVGGEARAAVHAYLSFLNAFKVKDGLFVMADEGTVTFRLEADDEASEDGGVEAAVRTAGTTAERFCEPIRALSAGLLTFAQVCRRG